MALDPRTWTLTSTADTLAGRTDWLDASDSVAGVVTFQVTGTMNVTLVFELTVDGSTAVDALALPSDSTTAITSIALNGSNLKKAYKIDCHGYNGCRVRCSVYTSGTVAIRAFPSVG